MLDRSIQPGIEGLKFEPLTRCPSSDGCNIIGHHHPRHGMDHQTIDDFISFRHPKVTKIYRSNFEPGECLDIWVTTDEEVRVQVVDGITMDRYPQTLFDFMPRIDSVDQAWFIMNEIIEGIIYIHSKGYILNPDPRFIYLSKDASVDLYEQNILVGGLIRPRNLPNEFRSKDAPLTFKSDVFSVCAIFLSMVRNIPSLDFDESMRSMLVRMVDLNPQERPSMAEVQDCLRSLSTHEF